MVSQESFQRLTQNIPKGLGLWKAGSDVCVSEDTILLPDREWTKVGVIITRENLPPLDGVWIEDLSFLLGSLKSRRAQSGVQLFELPGALLADRVDETAYFRNYDRKMLPIDPDDPRFREKSDFLYEQECHGLKNIFNVPQKDSVLVANMAARPIRLDKGMGLFRYYLPLTAPVSGKELIALVTDGEIFIDGKQGLDWDIFEDKGNPIGVMVRIDPQRERWIDDQGEPIYINDTDRNYRRSLDQMMSPLPKNGQVLCIGETPRTRLSKRVDGVIYRLTSPTIDGSDWLERANLHINSLVIDAGSDWPIRTETIGKRGDPRYIFYQFYLNRQ
jgi:hypothetical protein